VPLNTPLLFKAYRKIPEKYQNFHQTTMIRHFLSDALTFGEPITERSI
jgi:hypothetical protein